MAGMSDAVFSVLLFIVVVLLLVCVRACVCVFVCVCLCVCVCVCMRAEMWEEDIACYSYLQLSIFSLFCVTLRVGALEISRCYYYYLCRYLQADISWRTHLFFLSFLFSLSHKALQCHGPSLSGGLQKAECDSSGVASACDLRCSRAVSSQGHAILEWRGEVVWHDNGRWCVDRQCTLWL